MAQLQASMVDAQKELEEKSASSRNRDIETAALQKQIDVLAETLQSTRGRLVSKEEEMDDLAAKLRELQATKSQEATRIVTEASEKLAKEAERLRESVIGKAVQLKRSESSRAAAIQRLQQERQANAESIRRLSESVQRFYGSPPDE